MCPEDAPGLRVDLCVGSHQAQVFGTEKLVMVTDGPLCPLPSLPHPCPYIFFQPVLYRSPRGQRLEPIAQLTLERMHF